MCECFSVGENATVFTFDKFNCFGLCWHCRYIYVINHLIPANFSPWATLVLFYAVRKQQILYILMKII